MEAWPERAHQYPDDNRPSRDAQLHRRRHPGQPDGDGTQYHAQGKPYEDGQKVRILQPLHFVAEDFPHVVHGIGFAHDGQPVADLQAEVRRGQKVYPGTIDACDVDAVEVAESQGAELHAVNPIAGYEDASRDELTVYRVPVDVFLVPVHVFLLAEEDFDVLDIGPDGDDKQMVVFFQQGFGCRDAYLAVPPDARDDEMPVRQLHNLLDAFVIDGGIADPEFRHVGFHIFRCLGCCALCVLTLEEGAEDNDGQNHTYHA